MAKNDEKYFCFKRLINRLLKIISQNDVIFLQNKLVNTKSSRKFALAITNDSDLVK